MGIRAAVKRHWPRLHARGVIDLALCVILVVIASFLPRWKPYGWDAASVSTLVGALAGAAALLLGNWINRINDAKRAEAESKAREETEALRREAEVQRKEAARAERLAKVKALVTARLVAVALKLIHTKRLADAALTSQAHVDSELLLSTLPEGTGLLRDLGAELLELEPADLDALETLDTNLEINILTLSREPTVGLFRLPMVLSGLGAAMTVLAKCFERISPNRSFSIEGQKPVLASVILRERANATAAK
jgi:hypothetical protein